jgi:hypothetical protein
MSDLICRAALLKLLKGLPYGYAESFGGKFAIMAVEEAPAVNAVSLGAYEQVKWERDIAIAQLKELGIGFGQKKLDMVEVVRCKDCAFYIPWGDEGKICGRVGAYYGKTKPDDFCSRSVRMDLEGE